MQRNKQTSLEAYEDSLGSGLYKGWVEGTIGNQSTKEQVL